MKKTTSVFEIIKIHEKRYPNEDLESVRQKFMDTMETYVYMEFKDPYTLADLFFHACGMMRFSTMAGLTYMRDVLSYVPRKTSFTHLALCIEAKMNEYKLEGE